MKKVLLPLLLILFVQDYPKILAYESPTEWQQIPLRTAPQKEAGLPGGEGFQQIYYMSYAPSNPDVVYLVSDTSQVWKSTDGGTTWQMKHGGFKAKGGISITVDPTNESVVFVAATHAQALPLDTEGKPQPISGVYRTKNGGEAWELVNPVYYAKTTDDRGGNLISFASTGTIYAGTQKEGLFKSMDKGNTWISVKNDSGAVLFYGQKICDVKTHPQDPAVVFVSVSSNNAGLYKVVDNGATAAVYQAGSGLPSFPHSVTIDSNNPNVMYAAVGTYGVYKSTDGGISFSSRNNGLLYDISQNRSANYLSLSPADSDYLYVYFNSSFNSFYYTHDGGDHWYKPASMDEQNTYGWIGGSLVGRDGPSGIHFFSAPVAAHPTNRNVALMSGENAHIKKTADGGINWRYSNSGYTGGLAGPLSPSFSGLTPISWDAGNPDRFAIFLTDYGPFLTEDGGSTFKNLRVPRYLNTKTTHAGAIEPVPNSETIITAIGDFSVQKIAITRNEGANWTLIEGTDDMYQFIAFNPNDPNMIYAGKYKSTDNGYNWTELSRKVVAIHPKNGSIVYAAEVSGNNTVIFKSIDGGFAWTSPYPPIPAKSGMGQIAIGPDNENMIYLAVAEKGIYIINNSGLSLKNEANGLDKGWFYSLYTSYVAVDPVRPNVIYCGMMASHIGNSNGIFRSTDYGETWHNIAFNLGPEFSPYSISVNPYNGYVYVGSFIGTWRLPPPYDIVPPAAPSGFTATAISPLQINLSWNDSTDNIGVAGYIVYRNGAQIANITGTSYPDTGLSPFASYAYAISAYDPAGNPSNQSSPAFARTLHRSDKNEPYGCLEMEELSKFIDRWKLNSQDVPIAELMEAIGLWKEGC